MNETVSVSVSGAAFSLLLYENIKCEYDQDGFIFGNVISKETNKLTDADHRVVNREQIITVKSCQPCPQQFYFYDAAGKIDKEKISAFVGSQEKDLVGWYIFKRAHSSQCRLMLREKIIHKQLAELFCKPPSNFTCCLLTMEKSISQSRYSFSQTFIRYHKSQYESLPLHIANLSDPNYSFKTAEPMSDILSKIVKSIRSSGEAKGYYLIEKINDNLQDHMKKLVAESVNKEEQLFKLEEEVRELKRRLRMKRDSELENNFHSQGLSDTIIKNGEGDFEHHSKKEETPQGNQPKRKGRPRRNQNTPSNNIVTTATNCDITGNDLKHNEIASASSIPKSQNIRGRKI